MVFMVAFDINHQCPGSGVQFCPRDSSDHSLTLTQQNRPLRQYFTRRALTGHEAVIARNKKKNLQAVMLLEVSWTTLLSLWASKGQNLWVAFFLFSWKREKIVLTLESLLFLFITGVRGPVIFIWHMADILILAVYVRLWCQPLQFSFPRRRLWHDRVVCAMFTVFLSHLRLCPETLLKSMRLQSMINRSRS